LIVAIGAWASAYYTAAGYADPLHRGQNVHPLIPWFEAPVLHIPLPGLDKPLPLHGFGFLVALGFIFGSKIAMNRAKRVGLDPDVINRLVGWLVAGTFIGGHIGYGLLYKPDEYLANPIEFLKVWQGLSSFGGFVVCVPLAIWFFARERKPVWPYLDSLALGMSVGWFFGRMGCFVAHDHPGTVTNFWLGVYGICQPISDKNVACHDMGLYEGLWSLAMFGVLSVMDRRPLKPGVLVLTYGLTYGPLRFLMDFLRPEATDARYGGFTPGQYGSVLVTVVCLAALVIRLRSSDAPVGPARDAPPQPTTA
jgi:phosphatidylglycerol---prolipoprotein diacylglyceryl transferase